MFKFKGISSNDMQVVIEEEEHFIARASQRYEITEIEGKDGAIFDELGYSIVERPIYVQCLNINKIDDILAWLNGEGEFEYKGRKTTARFYSQLEPQRSSCIRIIDTTFIRDPFWNKANEDYQLVKDRKDKQASGEYIHVEDSSNCRAKIGISGNSEQDMRSGKNYLNTLAKYKAGEKVTVDGITYIFNEDGSITCNGTATADSVLTFSSNLQTINGSGKKIVGMLTGTQVPAKLSILAYTSDWSKNTFELLSSVNKNITINMQENIDYTIFRIIAYKGTTLNNQTIYYQILDTSVNDLTYEQYGVSPSPDYKSEIESVGSNVNLFDKDNMTIGKIWNGTTLLDSDVGNASPKIPVTAGKTYIRNAGYSSNYIIKENNSVVDVQGGTNAITMPEDAKYWMFNIPKDIDINTIKAEEGSISTPQSKYGQGCVKVTKCNKNIYNKNEEIICNGVGIGANGELFSRSDQKLLIIPISKLETNIAISLTKTFSYSLRYAFSDKIVENIDCKIFDTGYVENSTTTNIKVNKTVQNNKHNYLLLSFTKKDSYSDLQVEYKKEVSQYEEHQEQSYIMPVQKEMLEGDYVADVEHHEWKKLTLTGNENIKLNTAFANVFNIEIPKINIMNQQVCLCNIAKGVVYNTALLTIQDNIIMTASLNKIVYKSTKFSSLSEFKTYLQNQYEEGTPVIVYYKLAEPINLELTDEQKAVAKELSNARTYKNVTNITTDSKAKLSLDYFTVTDETIKNEGNIQSRPVLRLEKTVSEAVEITINNVRFKYNFNNDTYVEIDCENKTVEYEGINRNRNLFISYDFPKLNIGSNNIIMNDGDCIIKVIRKDRWL